MILKIELKNLWQNEIMENDGFEWGEEKKKINQKEKIL